jgi:hypothetical protein
MHLPKSSGFKYIVQGRCSLIHYVEFQMLQNGTAISLSDWIFEDIICHWETLSEIVSNNGGPFVKALAHLSKKYHINDIHISGYNSCANGLVEWTHFDVRQSLFKAVDGDQVNGVELVILCFGPTKLQFGVAWAVHLISQQPVLIQYSPST